MLVTKSGKKKSAFKYGDKEYLAAVTGYSPVYVYKVVAGKASNEQISWAADRLKQLREQFENEYQEKFKSKQAS